MPINQDIKVIEKSNKLKTIIILAIVIISCLLMAIVDGIIQPPYFLKSLLKVIIFLGGITLYGITMKENLLSMLRFNKKGMVIALALGLGVYGVIIGGYFLLRNVFDFSNIITSLSKNGDITKENFLYVSLYISFINSFLEEVFFRGFAFGHLKTLASKRLAYSFSAILFACYHIAIMLGWFSWLEYLVMMVGLFIGGMIFNYLNDKLKCLYPSWFVHMFANFAINTVGMILFGIF